MNPTILLHHAFRTLPAWLFLSLFFCLGAALAQSVTVSGTVTDATNEGLPGVSVLVKGTTRGTVTDINGSYSLDNLASSDTLLFTSVGFTSQSVVVGSKNTINVTMLDDVQALNEVVVVGYTAERKVDLTGAIAVVELEPVKGQSMSSGNPAQALQGRVPGLYIERSGDPTGTTPRILIRGANTLGDNNPLYIIDGVPTTRPEVFASLNPSVIESVQVLKDASAASIYGSRASNGVLIVQTKNRVQGADEKFTVAFNSNVSVLSEQQQRFKMLNAVDRGRALWQASVNDRTDPASGYGEIYNFDWNGDYDNPVLNSVTVKPFVGGDPNVPAGDTDWQDVMYKTGYVYNNDLTVSGGNERAFLLANFGYLHNTGILQYTGYRRYTGKLNANFNLFDNRLKFGVNSQFATSNETLASPDVGSAATPGLAVSLAPTIPVYTLDGNFAGPLGSGYSDRNNPLLMQYINRWDNTHRDSFLGNAYASLELLKNLNFRTSLGVDYNQVKVKNIEPRVANGFITRTINSLNLADNDYLSLTFSNTLTYNLALGQHVFDFLVGTEAVKTDLTFLTASAQEFAVETEDFFVLNAATGLRNNTGDQTGSRLLSQFGKIGYRFGEKYLASFTLRRDGSSRFGANNRYGIFPAATVGWRLDQEDFMQELPSLSQLKLRAGYGTVGNQSIGDLSRFGLFAPRYGLTQEQVRRAGFFFDQFYNVGTAYDLAGANTGTLPSGFVSTQGANPDLRWESTTELNMGIDFGFWNQKLQGSFDYYTRVTRDILITPPVASAAGEGVLRTLNGATVKNKGWEFALGYSDETSNGLRYTVSTNFSGFKDRITELPEEVRTGFAGNAEQDILGQSQFAIFGYRTDGLFQNQADVDAHATQVGAAPGRIRYKDLNGDGMVNALDQEFFGTTLPTFQYGVSLNLSYRNFDLSAFGSGVAGRRGFDNYIFYNEFIRGRDNVGPGTLTAWTPQNTSSTIPALTLSDGNNETRSSDYLFVKNSYFKLRNLSLGYTLPETAMGKLGPLSYLRLYLQAENLFWIKSGEFKGPDPERRDVNAIPVPSVYSLGLNVRL
ncbi:TonB-linked outer membrane protein, SusC/RagA family [Catalinimonas alkaloidigena]|uniref:TonB-linked outer membrane protein, SusC/RagA family n=1 Tax=Catalinimonas alkaloidigena TaxID=1075417 RepID=A0A1G8WZE6_9BACT|nr:TonB-dependent receptor [Catalinimonas alkaloidigena]SDJ83487.1 TonB-linked outer membrane protein, SusC/RagA family [Catalinimonas alkaloidigena]